SPPGAARTSRPGWQAVWGRVPGWGQRAGPCWWLPERPGPAAPPAESGPAGQRGDSLVGQEGTAVALPSVLRRLLRAAGGVWAAGGWCRAGPAAPGPGLPGPGPMARGVARGW